MARKSRGPWYWKLRKEWVVNVRGKRHYLGANRKAAFEKWHDLEGQPEPVKVESNSVWEVLDAFLESAKADTSEATYNWYPHVRSAALLRSRLSDEGGRLARGGGYLARPYRH
jgi:hypothetical protein